jgi:hypothetical protein
MAEHVDRSREQGERMRLDNQNVLPEIAAGEQADPAWTASRTLPPEKLGAPSADRKHEVLSHNQAAAVRSISDAVVIKDGEPFFLCPPDPDRRSVRTGRQGQAGGHAARPGEDTADRGRARLLVG